MNRVRQAQEHFAYEEYPDAQNETGVNYVVHPLSLGETTRVSESALQSVKEHLKRTLKHYGNPVNTKGGTEIVFARLRLRSLITLCHALHDFTDLDLEVQKEIFGEKLFSNLLLDEWKVDGMGNVVDCEGKIRYNRYGEEVH